MRTKSGVNFTVSGSGTPTIIFVHGFSCGLEDWQGQIEALSSTFRCVALDLPGHGASAKPAEVSMSALGTAVNDVRNHIGAEDVVLVGHSLGAKVIREAYWQQCNGVAGLVLIDGAFYDGDRETMLQRATMAIDSAGFAAYTSAHFDSMFTDRSTPEFRDRIVKRALKLDPDFGRALYLEAVTWDPARGKDTLRRIAVPLLVIQSTHIGSDLARHPMRAGVRTVFMDVVAELVPKSQELIIEGIGHFTMNEAPGEVNRALREFVTHASASGAGGSHPAEPNERGKA
jgi:pimeloyl-ACP methyl ester carboxylesterase